MSVDLQLRNKVINMIRLSDCKPAMCEMLDSLSNHDTIVDVTDDFIVVTNPALFEMYVLLVNQTGDTIRNMVSVISERLSSNTVYNIYLNKKSYKELLEYPISSICYTRKYIYDVMSLEPTELCDGKLDIAQPEDIGSILKALIDEYGITEDNAFYDIITETAITRLLNNSYVVIRENDAILSQLYICEDADDVFIKGVLTPKQYRGLGYAKALLKQVISSYANKGKTLHLIVDQSNNVAKKLYESLGFKITDTLYSYMIT